MGISDPGFRAPGRSDSIADSGLETKLLASPAPAVLQQGPESLPAPWDDLYRNSGAESLGLNSGDFAQILLEVRAQYTSIRPDRTAGPDTPDRRPAVPNADEDFYARLHVEELALARACAKGSERAWEVFLTRYREKLYAAARSIAKEEAAARELADSLYADLFGMNKDGAPRTSKLASYTGRGSLEGWLRTVLAQQYINRCRGERRLVSLEEQAEAGVQFRAHPSSSEAAPDPRLEAAVGEALASLPAEDRFILASYYLDGRTLAEVARLLGVHESTISRRVEKITRAVRKRLVAGLVERGMSRAQAEEALEADVRDLTLDVRGRLAESATQEKGGGTVP